MGMPVGMMQMIMAMTVTVAVTVNMAVERRKPLEGRILSGPGHVASPFMQGCFLSIVFANRLSDVVGRSALFMKARPLL